VQEHQLFGQLAQGVAQLAPTLHVSFHWTLSCLRRRAVLAWSGYSSGWDPVEQYPQRSSTVKSFDCRSC
jgi:hypothetical protein